MNAAWRALRSPFTARAGRTFVYCFCEPFLTLGALIVIAAATALSIAGGGVPALLLIPPTLAFCRGVGSAYRGLARNLLDADIPAPSRAPRRPGALGFVLYHFAEQTGWRALAHVFVKLLLLVFEFVVGVGFRLLLPVLVLGLVESGAQLNAPVLLLVSGAVFLAAPPLTELLLLLDLALTRRLLGPTEDSLRIRELEQTRTHAINEASATLRRIERDLHDGAQARLVALGIRLGRAESQLERGRTEAGLALLRESRAETKEIVQELRDLVRGIHPPALDGGLEPALSTLAALTPIPTTIRVALPARLPAAAETMLYFAAAELLTNASKHSGADAQGPGSGLRGLTERVRGLDGRLSVDSPTGGPTTVIVELPAQDVHDARPEPAEGH